MLRMKKKKASIYDFPTYYDLVFGSDTASELAFLDGCFDRFVDGPVKRAFEPACGTGRLMNRMAQSKNIEVGGLDLNPKAVEFCNRRLERHGIRDRVVVGDMTDFERVPPFDACFNTINSFRHLLSEKMALDHLNCISNSMKTGGIYVLGLHLLPTDQHECEGESWSAQRGHLAINTQMWQIDLNLKKRIETFRLQFDVYTPTDRQQISDDVQFRTYTAQQILSLIAKSSLDLTAVYDFAYETTEPIALDEKTEDVVLVLQKNQ